MTLIDANVLIAAFLPGHVHHERAVMDLLRLRAEDKQVILHPLAVAAFFRLTTSEHLGIPPAKLADCMAFVRSLNANLSVVPFTERVEHLDAFELILQRQKKKRPNVNDAWLAASATAHQARVLIYDSDFDVLLKGL